MVQLWKREKHVIYTSSWKKPHELLVVGPYASEDLPSCIATE
jgi:hypothetical protein